MTEVAVKKSHQELVLAKYPTAFASDGALDEVVYIIDGISQKELGFGPNDEEAWASAYYEHCIN